MKGFIKTNFKLQRMELDMDEILENEFNFDFFANI
jgi:hypothetical protein